MFKPSSQFRKNICFALAIFYIVGLFHQSILEGCHTLMHLCDTSSGEFNTHRLADHEVSHKHLALNFIDEMINKNANKNLPFENKTQKQTKKLSQICGKQLIKNILFNSKNNKPSTSLNHFFLENYSPLIIPPPKI